jgi:hypothetical protein
LLANSSQPLSRSATGLLRPIALVDIGDAQRTAGDQGAGGDRHVLGDGAGCHAGDHRHVVGAVNGKAHLLSGAVERCYREAVDLAVTRPEKLDSTFSNRVAVAAVRRQCQLAEIAGRAYHRRLE